MVWVIDRWSNNLTISFISENNKSNESPMFVLRLHVGHSRLYWTGTVRDIGVIRGKVGWGTSEWYRWW